MSGITQIKMIQIAPSKQNPRRNIDENSIKELAESLKQLGMLQPIIVRPDADGFEIVCGERRYLAAEKAKLKEVPCIVRDLTDDEAEDFRITENLQRQDISPLDEAEAYKLLVEHRQYTPLMISTRFGKSETYVRHRLQLNYLIEDFAKLLEKELITLGHALEICKISPANQSNLFDMEFTSNGSRYGLRSVKDMRDKIERNYSSKLKLATFDLNETYPCAELPCNLCPHNTAFNQLLFPEMQTEGICMNPVCYAAKSAYQFRQNLVKVVEEEPTTALIAPNYLYGDAEKDLDKLISEGLLVEKIPNRLIITKPEAPEEPSYEDRMENPELLDEYTEELEEYKEELAEYETKIQSGDIRKCLMVAGNDKGKFVYAERDKTSTAAGTEPAELTELTGLKAKDKRNAELQFEKTYLESKALLQEMDYPKYSEDLTENEWAALMQVMWFAVSSSLAKSMGEKESSFHQKQNIDFMRNLMPSQRNQVMRSFLLNKLDTSTPGYLPEEAKALLQITAERFPDEAKTIVKQQEEVYQKRKKSIDSRIYELEHLQLKAAVE